MGIFFQGYTLGGILAVIFLMAVLLLINEVTRKSKTVSIIAYCVLPVLLAVLIFSNVLSSPTGKTWFPWVKVVSALLGVYGFMLIRFTKLGKSKFAVIYPISILAINIAEAVYREFEIFMQYKTLQVDAAGIVVLGGPWNILNAIAGILCIVTLTGFAGIKVSKDKSKDMIWPDMTWIYIVGYTLWNFAYVYNCLSTRAMYAGFTILTAAIVAEIFFKRGAWLQHRAQTLALYAMFSLSVDFQRSEFFRIIPIYKESNLMTISVISFAFNVGMVLFMIYTIRKHKKNPLKEDIYVDTKYYKKTMEVNNLNM